MKKLLLFITALCFIACDGNNPSSKGEYVDLGLSSGTKWKSENELNQKDPDSNFYTFDEAINAFGGNLPSKENWEELINECTWTWKGNGCRVSGPNGKSIFLPAFGYCDCEGRVDAIDQFGLYCSASEDGATYVWSLYVTSDEWGLDGVYHCTGVSVRLVK